MQWLQPYSLASIRWYQCIQYSFFPVLRLKWQVVNIPHDHDFIGYIAIRSTVISNKDCRQNVKILLRLAFFRDKGQYFPTSGRMTCVIECLFSMFFFVRCSLFFIDRRSKANNKRLNLKYILVIFLFRQHLYEDCCSKTMISRIDNGYSFSSQ
jgi:hypothetical protein